MARPSQTARKTTGGKPPRRQVATAAARAAIAASVSASSSASSSVSPAKPPARAIPTPVVTAPVIAAAGRRAHMASIWDSIEEPEQPTTSATNSAAAAGSSSQPIAVDDSEESKTGTLSEDDTEMLLQEKETPSKSFGKFFAVGVDHGLILWCSVRDWKRQQASRSAADSGGWRLGDSSDESSSRW